MPFKPMKPPAGSLEDADLCKLKFPLYAMPKLDGLRASVQGGVLLSSTLKPIPNKFLQERFGKPEYEGLDGELIEGDPRQDPFNSTTSACMNVKFEPRGVRFFVFDKFGPEGYTERYADAFNIAEGNPHLVATPIFAVGNLEQLSTFEETCIGDGYEGTMLRSPTGLYKQGRSTMTDQGLLRRKPFADGEAIILGTVEAQENTNAAMTNELGRTKRSSAKAGKVGKGTLGKYNVVGLTVFPGVKFDITAWGDMEQRQTQWDAREQLVGKIIKFKYQKYGSKDAPRLPIPLGFRDIMDISL